MNAPLSAEVLLLRESSSQASLPLAAQGVQRWLWEGRYGRMLIEVVGGCVYVNSQLVEAHAAVKPPAEQT
jgi:hypothetical protein